MARNLEQIIPGRDNKDARREVQNRRQILQLALLLIRDTHISNRLSGRHSPAAQVHQLRRPRTSRQHHQIRLDGRTIRQDNTGSLRLGAGRVVEHTLDITSAEDHLPLGVEDGLGIAHAGRGVGPPRPPVHVAAGDIERRAVGRDDTEHVRLRRQEGDVVAELAHVGVALVGVLPRAGAVLWVHEEQAVLRVAAVAAPVCATPALDGGCGELGVGRVGVVRPHDP